MVNYASGLNAIIKFIKINIITIIESTNEIGKNFLSA
jgi:hypothetical protein